MKTEEDETDEIIRKRTKLKNNFSEKILQKKIKNYESTSSDSEVEFFEKRPLHSGERLKKV